MINRPHALCLLLFVLWPVNARAAQILNASEPKKRCSICFSVQHGRLSCPEVMQSDIEGEHAAEDAGSELRSHSARLRAACRSGDAAEVDEILTAGVDVNAHDRGLSLLDSPLHRAAYWGHAAVAERLLSAGAQVFERNRVGYTALHWASIRGAADVVELLLSASADVNAVEREGNTPLHFAAREGFPHICHLLVKGGAHINGMTSVWQYTPLMYAAMRGEISCVRLLLSLGAHVEMTCAKGLSALEWAQSLRRNVCVHMLSGFTGRWQSRTNFADISPELAELEQLGLLTVPLKGARRPPAEKRTATPARHGTHPGNAADRSSGGRAVWGPAACRSVALEPATATDGCSRQKYGRQGKRKQRLTPGLHEPDVTRIVRIARRLTQAPSCFDSAALLGQAHGNS